MDRLISFAIPTKNRYKYLLKLIDSVAAIDSEIFEIVIHDNTEDNSEILQKISTITDNRIRYIHHPETLDMVENSDKSISYCSGEYVCFLGDDDGFTPQLLRLIPWLKNNNIKILNCGIPIYEWPDVKHPIYGDRFSGRISFKKFKGKVKTIDAKKQLEKVVDHGGTKMFKLPKLYHGVVHKSILAKLFQDHNSYFPGPSPDMACSVAICKYVDSFTYVDLPLIITGHGAKSAGGKGVAKKHIGSIAEQTFLPKDTVSNWNRKIPSIWTGQTIWAHTCLYVLGKNQEFKLIERFKFNYLYGALINQYPHLFGIVKPFISKNGGIFKIIFPYISVWIARLRSLIGNVFKVYFNKSFIYHTAKFNNINDAIQFVEDKMQGKLDSFDS